jgi:hypothetical protein
MQFCRAHGYPLVQRTRLRLFDGGTHPDIAARSDDLSPFIGDDEEPGRPATGDLIPARPVSEAGPRSSSDERKRLSHRTRLLGWRHRQLCLPGVRRPHAPPRALAARAAFSCAAVRTGSSSDSSRWSRLGVERRP